MFDRSDCILRPINLADLELILKWRNSDRIRQNMYTDRIIMIEEHRAWFDRSLLENSCQHLIYEYQKQPLGVVNINQIDTRNGLCSWGFYVGDASAQRNTGLAMGFLAINHIFEKLSLRKISSEAFAFNQASVNYHLRLGFIQEGCWKEHFYRADKYQDIICLALFKDRWEAIKSSIDRRCFAK